MSNMIVCENKGNFNEDFYKMIRFSYSYQCSLQLVVNHALNMNEVAGGDMEHLTVVSRDSLQLCDGLTPAPCLCSISLSLGSDLDCCCVLTVSPQHSHLAA